jgi:hypothetical protein
MVKQDLGKSIIYSFLDCYFVFIEYSSKTHTMLGKFPMDKLTKDNATAYMSILESEAGIMPRAIHHIFQGLQRQV